MNRVPRDIGSRRAETLRDSSGLWVRCQRPVLGRRTEPTRGRSLLGGSTGSTRVAMTPTYRSDSLGICQSITQKTGSRTRIG